MTSSTVTSSETSSQDNSYMPAPQASVSVASPAYALEYPREYLTAAQDSSVTDYSSTPGGENCAVNGFSSGLFIASGSESYSRHRQCDEEDDGSREVKAVSNFVAEAGVSCNASTASRSPNPIADAAEKAPEVSVTIVGANNLSEIKATSTEKHEIKDLRTKSAVNLDKSGKDVMKQTMKNEITPVF